MFVALTACALLATVGALVLRGTVVWAAVLAWSALVGYVAMLLRIKREAAGRAFHRDALLGAAGTTADGVGHLDAEWDDADGGWDGWADEHDLHVARSRDTHDLDDWNDWDLVDAR